ncbi:MAG: hypothetical protein PHW56_12410, partial [Methanosarcinaceae archaeon]|nr:hypothetical protein [Methanosarcinaceae archaeon]
MRGKITTLFLVAIFCLSLTGIVAANNILECEACEENSTLRIYGTYGEGPGDQSMCDPDNPGFKPENPPYTDPEAPFYPQAEQAPRKDFVTFNPAIMDHNQGWDRLLLYPCNG